MQHLWIGSLGMITERTLFVLGFRCRAWVAASSERYGQGMGPPAMKLMDHYQIVSLC